MVAWLFTCGCVEVVYVVARWHDCSRCGMVVHVAALRLLTWWRGGMVVHVAALRLLTWWRGAYAGSRMRPYNLLLSCARLAYSCALRRLKMSP